MCVVLTQRNIHSRPTKFVLTERLTCGPQKETPAHNFNLSFPVLLHQPLLLHVCFTVLHLTIVGTQQVILSLCESCNFLG